MSCAIFAVKKILDDACNTLILICLFTLTLSFKCFIFRIYQEVLIHIRKIFVLMHKVIHRKILNFPEKFYTAIDCTSAFFCSRRIKFHQISDLLSCARLVHKDIHILCAELLLYSLK